ncbi:pyruvate dehydrogenase E2 component (dihydrolipoamide acetyltransferase) [Blastococcus sp. DSM 46786]|uniref:dihydrolipoamide acetyltransferase family protein n=1 Tax=Blastococcus sp. DSM 46786 TaxID=1798227 RepID=UPI0008BA6243|nr:dihydrolipoamide acetyltransferase family protein [Blastococcus sp. DSM 46786]SEK19916.1 pyruvate dehydrogenase E2 component (dihydrolipoamide acetyltransferase) [Blastococcus sp. DSM 46786]
MSELEFRLPDVGEGLDAGEIVEWHVQPGSTVVRDQVLADVETDKAVVEIPSPVNGTVLRLGGDVGDVLEIGALLVVFETEESVRIRSHGSTGPATPQSAGKPPAVGEQPAAAPALPTPVAVAQSPETGAGGPSPDAAADGGGSRTGRVLASPATRRLALEMGVDLGAVRGSGPGGRVTSDDVRSFATAPAVADTATAESAPSPRKSAPAAGEPRRAVRRLTDETVPLRGLRRSIAKSMTASWREIPHITEFREVDATALVQARATLRPHLERDGVPFTFLPLLVKAVVATLAEHPKFNASIDMDAETITYHGRRNIGLATSTGAGLMVPVVKDADAKSLGELAREIDGLAAAARDRSVTPAEMSEGTFSITNFGSYGGWLATPIIRPSEAAIAGFGRIRDAVVPVDGVPVVRPTLPLSVSADHRLVDGEDLGGFLATLIAYLADPILLLKGE